jgi:predicted metal-binding membrane protein
MTWQGSTAMEGMPSTNMLGSWSASYLGGTLLMWTIMMAAMMLPSAIPAIRRFALASRRADADGRTVVPTTLFVAGYFFVWIGFSAAATLLQALLRHFTLLSHELSILHPWIVSSVLFAAGVYQFTRWKGACLLHCQSPLAFLLQHWRNGRSGAVAMGLRHGFYCLGCCWALMLVLFTVGVMNIGWVAALALVILLEKVAVRGLWLSRLAGAALIGWAVLQFAV